MFDVSLSKLRQEERRNTCLSESLSSWRSLSFRKTVFLPDEACLSERQSFFLTKPVFQKDSLSSWRSLSFRKTVFLPDEACLSERQSFFLTKPVSEHQTKTGNCDGGDISPSQGLLQSAISRSPWEGETSLHHPNFPSLSDVPKQVVSSSELTKPAKRNVEHSWSVNHVNGNFLQDLSNLRFSEDELDLLLNQNLPNLLSVCIFFTPEIKSPPYERCSIPSCDTGESSCTNEKQASWFRGLSFVVFFHINLLVCYVV